MTSRMNRGWTSESGSQPESEMLKCGITLISKDSGQEIHFESIFHATCFLNRGGCYINNVLAYGGTVTHGDTGEAFDVIRDVPKVGVIECKSLNQAKMLDKSICNGCARAVCFCSWFAENKPVDGWTAEKTYDADGNFYSYCVKKCPLFMKDGSTVKERRLQRKKLMQELTNGTDWAKKEKTGGSDREQ